MVSYRGIDDGGLLYCHISVCVATKESFSLQTTFTNFRQLGMYPLLNNCLYDLVEGLRILIRFRIFLNFLSLMRPLLLGMHVSILRKQLCSTKMFIFLLIVHRCLLHVFYSQLWFLNSPQHIMCSHKCPSLYLLMKSYSLPNSLYNMAYFVIVL